MTETSQQRQAALDAPTAIVAAAYLGGLNLLIVNLQPLILGAMADGYGLSDRQLGYVSASFIGFATLCSLSGPLWVRRIDWRLSASVAATLAAIALASGAILSTPGAIMILFALLGILKGGLGIPSFASLGDSSNPDRNYGVAIGVQALLSAAITAPAAAYIIPHYGVSGLFLMLSAMLLTGLVVCHWLPRGGREQSAVTEAGVPVRILSSAAVPVFIGLFAMALFTGGILGFWYFIERIGVARGVSPGAIGVTLSLCSLATIATASIVAWLGGRLAGLIFVGAGTLLILVGYSLLQVQGEIFYLTGALSFAMGWGLAQPAYQAMVRKVDATGRMFVVVPAAGGIAGVVIGMVAGPIIEFGGYQAMIIVSSILIVGAGVTLTAARAMHLRSGKRLLAGEAAPAELPPISAA